MQRDLSAAGNARPFKSAASRPRLFTFGKFSYSFFRRLSPYLPPYNFSSADLILSLGLPMTRPTWKYYLSLLLTCNAGVGPLSQGGTWQWA